MTSYNTNLSAEFHVLSLLHRWGADAYLTLGNKKAVDITVMRPDEQTVTVDVKGVAKRYDWPPTMLSRSTTRTISWCW